MSGVAHLLFARTATLCFWNTPLREPCCVNQTVLHRLSLCLFEPLVLLPRAFRMGNRVLATVSQCLFFNVYQKVFIHSAHAYTTMPYLEVIYKRIIRSLRHVFVKWIIADWQGLSCWWKGRPLAKEQVISSAVLNPVADPVLFIFFITLQLIWEFLYVVLWNISVLAPELWITTTSLI